MVTPLRLVFFGTPRFAVPSLQHLLASSHTVAGVVTQPDRPRGRGQRVTDAPVKTAALAAGLPVYQPETLRTGDATARLAAFAPDLGVVAAYGTLIPQAMLEVPRLGMINVHASLLPRYRGAAPVHRAVIAGETETGVTIMRVIRELDAGGMFARAVCAIGPDETSDAVEERLAVLGADILGPVVDALAAGTAREAPQDASQATYAARLTREDGRIDWSRSARAIHDQVRGLYPWPHAYTFADGARLIILTTRVAADATVAVAGTVIAADGHGILVAAGNGTVVCIERLQPEGRRPMSARDYLAGRPLPPGTTLEGP